MAEKLTELFHCMWRKEAIPQEFKDASIIHLYKRKGNPQVCDNHRGISLLSIAGKILAKILLNRLNAHLDQTGLLFSLPLTKVGIHFGHVRMYATPYPISLIIFILDLGPSYTDKLLEFRWVQIAHLS